MMNFLKSYWIAISICLVYSLIATGAAIYFIKSSSLHSEASSLKMAEQLKTAQEALEKSDTEMASIKEDLDKEKNLNVALKKTMAESDTELDNLRKSVASKNREKPLASSPGCQGSNPAFIKKQSVKLKNLRAELEKRDIELSERQKKLDDEKRKFFQNKSGYIYP